MYKKWMVTSIETGNAKIRLDHMGLIIHIKDELGEDSTALIEIPKNIDINEFFTNMNGYYIDLMQRLESIIIKENK